MSEDILNHITRFSTACISDALDALGVNGGCEQLTSLNLGRTIAGPAYTLQYVPVSGQESAPAGEYIDDVPSGSVIVISNSGRTFCTVWGDLLTHMALKKNIKGTVIDGCCRDAVQIRALGYPVFSKGTYMKSGKNRVKLVGKQVPVTISGTLVNPGDIVFADDSGVIVIPEDLLQPVYLKACEIEDMEKNILQDIHEGVAMKESRRKHGYNTVAWKKENTVSL